jgi:hypothetical protein
VAATTYAHTYVTVTLISIGKKAVSSECTMAVIIERTEAEEHKTALPRSGGAE